MTQKINEQRFVFIDKFTKEFFNQMIAIYIRKFNLSNDEEIKHKLIKARGIIKYLDLWQEVKI